MRYLLDTNIFIFLISEEFNRLSINQQKLLSDKDNELYVSEASLYEIAIKSRLGKSSFSHINIATLEDDRKKNGIKLLKSKTAYYLNIPNVPKVIDEKGKPHADPFDLLLISQAIVEKLPILSTDRYFPQYVCLDVIA